MKLETDTSKPFKPHRYLQETYDMLESVPEEAEIKTSLWSRGVYAKCKNGDVYVYQGNRNWEKLT